MEDVKAKSGKEDGSKRSHRYKERNGDSHRSREKRDRSEREKSVHSDSSYEMEKDVGKRKERNRDREKQHRREMSIDSDSKYENRSEKDKDRDKRKEKDRDIDKDRRRRQREKSIESDSKYEKKRDKEKDRGKRKEKDRDIDKDDQPSEREKSIDSDSKYEKDRERRKDKDKNHRNKIRDDGKERSRDKKRNRDEEVNDQDKDRDWEKEREEKRSRTREKDKERGREREREKKEREREEREKERDNRDREEKEKKDRERRSRGREKRRGYSSEDNEDDSKDHDKKRRRRETDDYKDKTREQPVSRSSKRKDDIDDPSPPRKVANDDKEYKETRTREEELEDEQKRLDDEMEKRRRRVQEWQELKRKKEESEREKLGETANTDEPKSGKTWTLDGESDDEDGGPIMEKSDTEMDVDETSKQPDEGTGNAMTEVPADAATSPQAQDGNGGMEEDEEIDPLDAFMNNMVLPEVEKLNTAMTSGGTDKNNIDLSKKDTAEARINGERSKKSSNKSLGRIIQGEDSDSDYGDVDNDEKQSDDEDDEEFIKRVKKTKAEKLSLVDHTKIDYKPFRKNFYIEVKEISRMTPEEVSTYRRQLELKIHGKDVPKPIKTWHQTGLTTKIMDTIKKLNYEKPMPIQAQALPVIMSGRDCIGIAKTGSGKTLAFVLPMLRHIKDQPPVEAGDGPIGLIMAPTRELVQQIHSDIRKFSKALGLGCVPVYGGSGVAQQISELKRGTEIVVCTPGRMIDILCTSAGKITNLRRVTYLVMDEADRMFDMGFEPQITRIVQNIRPDRQTVLFSATFPRQVEILARKVLNKPVELQVGGRSVVNKDIAQLVEVRPENDRILRLLELLGEWYEKGKILVFVQRQEKCDKLFQSMLTHGYPCLSLHGAKDQTDRESTISDFKNNVCNLLIATSIAARGLDVKELELVVNYDVPNHYEDYVHRVGRTGRAGRKGCAITFISEDDAKYAPDLVKALELSEQVVPDDLKALADGFMAKVNQGLEQAHGTGYGGSGFKFNEEEDEKRMAAKKAQAKEYGFEEDKSDSEDDDEGIRKTGNDLSQQAARAQQMAVLAAAAVKATPTTTVPPAGVLGITTPSADGTARAQAQALAAAMNLQHNLAKLQADALPEHYEAELEINDFPQNARWKVTHKETLGPISEWTGAAITTRGQYFQPGRIPGAGERKLYLFIEGPNEVSVKRAKAELKRVLEDITNQALSLPGGAQPGKYSVV
ncbi:DEAD-box ATP-dependent RNA helicase 42 [Linum grandiflorum]